MYAITDIETTGGHASANGITEISIYIHDGKRVVDHYHTLINPYQRIPTYITALTGINNEMVADAPGFEEVAAEIFEFLQGNIFVAHSVNFDYSFIKHQLDRCGYRLNAPKLCTIRLSRKIFSGLPSYSLGNLCRSLGISISDRHRADGDAKATVQLFDKILKSGGEEVIAQMLKRSSAEAWLPHQLDKNALDKLPHSPGVYYFKDQKKKIIYIGKAINIRKRVAGHFMPNNTERRRQDFMREVAEIDYKICAGELHALVLESAEIKRHWPKYNYAQKRAARRYCLYSYQDNRGFIRLVIDYRKKVLPSLYNFNLLHEGQTLLRKLIEEYGIDERLCGFGRRTANAETNDFEVSLEDHNNKVLEAMSALGEKLPSFAVVDDAPSAEEKICLLIEKGNFYGMGYVHHQNINNDLQSLKNMLEPAADNDFIRNSLYKFAELHPEKKVSFS